MYDYLFKFVFFVFIVPRHNRHRLLIDVPRHNRHRLLIDCSRLLSVGVGRCPTRLLECTRNSVSFSVQQTSHALNGTPFVRYNYKLLGYTHYIHGIYANKSGTLILCNVINIHNRLVYYTHRTQNTRYRFFSETHAVCDHYHSTWEQ